MPVRDLIIEGARQNNLKNVSLTLPQNRVIVVTGLSGSGKSSLAFDTVFAEGQWRFIESLSTYARLFIEKIDRPDVDSIRNIRPAIALEQRNSVKGSRSTVGTATELYDYFRILFAAIATAACPGCGRELRRWSPSNAAAHLLATASGGRAYVMFEADADRIEPLRRQGFMRFRQNGAEVENSASGPMFAVVDRLVINEENAARLAESLEAAWKQGAESAAVEIVASETVVNDTVRFSSKMHCAACNVSLPEPQPLLFSFNHPLGACPACKGFGNILDYDPVRVIPDTSLTLAGGAVEPWMGPAIRKWYKEFLSEAVAAGIDIAIPFRDLPEEHKKLVLNGGPGFYGVRDYFEEMEAKRYKLHVRVMLSRYRTGFQCPTCGGARLRPEALSYKIGGCSIAELSHMPFSRVDEWISSLPLTDHERALSVEAMRLVTEKLRFLRRVGLDYLTMSRASKTLSGGEYQRINLSNQLSSRLTGTLYVLDEPTVGLHARDTDRVTAIMGELSRAGNTVLVVEHDRSVMKAADWIVEMGPGGGQKGGEVLFNGSAADFANTDTLTARYLTERETIPPPLVRRKPGKKPWFALSGCAGNNLKGVDLKIPLGTFTCVTGVSGSGKSTLIADTLYPAVARALGKGGADVEQPEPFGGMSGIEHLKGIRLIDQSPIGRSPRSNPATYLKIFDPIRRVFADQPSAKRMGLTAGSFSFNVAGGRCEACAGEGFQKLEMYFFEDLYVTCDECKGRRYKPEVLYVTYLGRDIHQVLDMTIDEAAAHFSGAPSVAKKLLPLSEMGLGYLKLGQPAPTLSGGEAQRLKICSEIGAASNGVLYILDEPTTGLHFHDIRKFLVVVNRLVDAGNTVVVVEHNPDVIRCADWIIDLGPEGGDGGGTIVAEGAPEQVACVAASHTGAAIAAGV